MPAPPAIINAAGKLTALGGSAQSAAVANAQAEAAGRHVDLAALRKYAGEQAAIWTGAEAGCITCGAAAGVAISVAAVVTGGRAEAVRELPLTFRQHDVVIQAGHMINFGASITQMVRLGGGTPRIIGDANFVPMALLTDTLERARPDALLYVKSHHSIQENMISLDACIEACRRHNVVVIVDASAESDLTRYIAAGADLVTYSGGKAFGGPTAGFICGRADLVAHAEAQVNGIGRAMKVGKEQIAGLLEAMAEYGHRDEADTAEKLSSINGRLMEELTSFDAYDVTLRADEAGRPFDRVAVAAAGGAFDIRTLVSFLADGDPSIRTRNHHLDRGFLQIDPREIHAYHIDTILTRFREFASTL